MSIGLQIFIGIYIGVGAVGGILFHLIFGLFSDSEPTYKGFWIIIWNSDCLGNINNIGKIVIEIIYTITFLPYIVFAYSLLLVAVLIYFVIIKPFIFIFKKNHNRWR